VRGFNGLHKQQVVRSIRIAGSIPHFVRAATFDHIEAARYVASSRLSRMLKKSASGVLASLRGSTYRSVRLAVLVAGALPGERRVLARRGWAGEKSSLLEHPTRHSPLVL
jgi:hypothetical protein